MSPARIPDAVTEQVLIDYAAGVRLKEIVARHGVSKTFVSKVAIRHGLRRQYHKFHDCESDCRFTKLSPEQLNGILVDYKSGMLLKLIAHKHGVSDSLVRKMALKNGMRLRNPRRTNGVEDGGTIREIGA